MPAIETDRFSTKGSVHLDALRGASALIVLLGHTRALYFTSTTAPSSGGPAASTTYTGITRITIGNEAVMIFFVLSGFLVGGSVIKAFRQSKWSWGSYLSRRLTRLWLVLIPALVLGLALDHTGFKLFSSEASIYAAPIQQNLVTNYDAQHLSPVTFLGNIFFTQGILVPMLGTNDSLWSLANEFWYYILFPTLVIAILPKRAMTPRIVSLLFAIAIAWFIGLDILLLFPIWILGAMISTIPLTLTEKNSKLLALATAGILALATVLLRRSPVDIYIAQWAIAICSAALIYLIRHQTSQAKESIYTSVSGFFSRISYTLYLVHLPAAIFICALINRPWHIWARTGLNLSLWFAINLTLIGISYLFYRLFEANTDRVRILLTGLPQRRRPNLRRE